MPVDTDTDAMTSDHDSARLSLADDAPRARAHGRSGALLEMGGDLLRRSKLPAWAVVALLVAGMICFTVYSVLGSVADTDAIEAVVDARLEAVLADRIGEELDGTLDARIGEQIDKALEGPVGRVADARIAVFHAAYGCGPDLGLFLRLVADPKGLDLIDAAALPADLQLCMLLSDPSRTRKGQP